MKINTIGKITSGTIIDWFIIVQDDTSNTGGYLLIQSPTSDFSGDGYDTWFENLQEVKHYIKCNNLSIEWNDN